jgi:hypothetical protein
VITFWTSWNSIVRPGNGSRAVTIVICNNHIQQNSDSFKLSWIAGAMNWGVPRGLLCLNSTSFEGWSLTKSEDDIGINDESTEMPEKWHSQYISCATLLHIQVNCPARNVLLQSRMLSNIPIGI